MNETLKTTKTIFPVRPYLVKAGWAPNVFDMFSIEV